MLSRKLGDTRLQELEQTPYYLYDMALLDRTIDSVRSEAFSRGYMVHYAIKANFEEVVVDAIRLGGLGIDCVSGNEIRYAIDRGYKPSQIVFAGVGKSDQEIEYALERGIFAFNCESREELHIIDAIAERMGKLANVALRINPDIAPDTHKGISTGQEDSKFGISPQEIEQIIEEVSTLTSINISGLHFHIGSQIVDLAPYVRLCGRVNELYRYFIAKGFDIKHINVGGGLGINYDDPESGLIPDFASYFSVFEHNLDLPKQVRVHFELGRSIVGQSAELITKVLYNKRTAGGKNYAIVDASMSELIRPALYGAMHAIENISDSGDRELKTHTIAGTVCESSDVFREDLKMPELRRGDILAIKSAGAYGTAMASYYNMHNLPRSIYFSDDLKDR